MLSRKVGAEIKKMGVNYPFMSIRDIFLPADLSVVNLESIVGTQTKFVDKEYVFQAEPSVLKGLKWAGIDAVSLANNHSFDCFSAGVIECADSVWNSGIIPLGIGKNSAEFFRPHSFWIQGNWFVIMGLNDTKSGFWGDDKPGCAPTWTARGESIAVDIISTLAEIGAIVIVFEHWGWEYQQFPDERQLQLGHKLIRAGAKVVVGSHPHRIQGVEFYKNGVIAYSLGNLIFDQKDSLGNIGAILELTFIGNRIYTISMLPVEMFSTFAQPKPANSDSMLEYFRNLSLPLNTDVYIEDGRFFFRPLEKQE